MKIAVYTIALNEESNVQQWYDSAKDADYLLIADTGSTDKTVRLAKKLGINVVKISVKPWRFDDARNAALALLPDDIDMCISLDMDEVLVPGWREALEKLDNDVTQVTYRYTWSWRDPQSRTQPQTIYIANKVHARHGYRWKYLVHELPFPDRNENHKIDYAENFEIHHYQEIQRNETRYSPMINDAFEETKDEKRYWIYKIDALLGERKNKEATGFVKEYIKKFDKELTDSELSKAYHSLFIASNRKSKRYIKKAHKINPQLRDYVVDIAMYYFVKGKLRSARKYCKIALSITTRTLDYTYQEYVWGYLAKNMLYVCNHNLKFKNRKNKLTLNVGTITSSSFDLFKD